MNLSQAFNNFFSSLGTDVGLLISVILSVLAFTFVYFYLIKFLIKNNAVKLVVIFIVTIILSAIIVVPNPQVNNLIILAVPFVLVFAVVILFSVEIKRMIWSHKSSKNDSAVSGGGVYDEEKVDKCIEEIIKAVQDMSKNDVGAIIVLASNNVPSQILDSGVRLESDISSELVESVFFPKTPLHDGAMIIDGAKIVAAGCFLPLSQNINNIPKDLGTRHRAGIGVTETIDVVSIIVSEETGIISVAKAGKITRYADYNMLKKTLKDYYWQELSKERR